MKIQLTPCQIGGLRRPQGPITIESSEVVGKDMLVAKLSGKSNAQVAAVKKGDRYYFVAPKKLGGTQEIPADSLTDCLNYAVRQLGNSIPEEHKRKVLPNGVKPKLKKCGG